MTTSNNKKNDQAPETNNKKESQETSMEFTSFIDSTDQTSLDVQAQSLAYQFGLLPSEDAKQFEKQLTTNNSYRGSLEEAHNFQDLLNCWSNLKPPPEDLSERTLSFIQEKIKQEAEKDSKVTDPSA